MNKILITLVLTVALNFCVSHADTVSSKEFIECAKAFDGQTVTYSGEVVTAIMNRGEYSWINLNDDYNAIGVWCRRQDLAQVKCVGNYENKGDILEVKGVFHRACAEHGGELDIHAEGLTVIKAGYCRKAPVDMTRIKLTAIFLFLTLSMIIIFRKRL